MLKLIQTALGQFDLAVIDDAADLRTQNLKTIIYATIFTDQRAPEGRVADPFDQRGWWFDPTLGTGLWYVRRQALSDAARRETINMMQLALNAQPDLSDIVVSEVQSETYDEALRNVSRVNLNITGVYDGAKFNLVLYVVERPPSSGSPTPSNVWNSLWNQLWSLGGNAAGASGAWDVEWNIEWV